MRNPGEFVKTSVAGGFFVVLPVVLLLLVLIEIVELLLMLLEPIVDVFDLDAEYEREEASPERDDEGRQGGAP